MREELSSNHLRLIDLSVLSEDGKVVLGRWSCQHKTKLLWQIATKVKVFDGLIDSSDTFDGDNTELSEDFFANDNESGKERAFYGFYSWPSPLQ